MNKEKIIELLISLLGDEKAERSVTSATKEDDNGKIKIVVLQRGWVQIGRFYRKGMDCRLENAHIIRKWGTSEGLGQLAFEGKQEETIFDRAGTSTFDYLTVCFTLDCNEEKWKSAL